MKRLLINIGKILLGVVVIAAVWIIFIGCVFKLAGDETVRRFILGYNSVKAKKNDAPRTES